MTSPTTISKRPPGSGVQDRHSVECGYTDGNFAGETQWVKRPDGTQEFYNYTTNVDGTVTTVVKSGQAGGTDIANGTKTITMRGPLGETRSIQTWEITNGIPGLQLSGGTHYYDYLGRSTNITYWGGLVEDRHYDCCGLDWEMDREGLLTNYEYDSLKRLYLTTRNNITLSNSFDAAGNVVSVSRQAGINTPILQRQYFYDLASRLTNEIDAVENSTLYTYSWESGFRKETTTYAGGTADVATHFEKYYQDGSLYDMSGSAVNPLRSEYGAEPVEVEILESLPVGL